jgi:hypothetical protein
MKTEKAEMERLTMRKLNDNEDRVFAWDPDEYTEAFRLGLVKRRVEKAENNLTQNRSKDLMN